MTTATVNCWGSQYGVRFGKNFRSALGITDKTRLGVTVDGDKIILTRSKTQARKSIQEYFKDYPTDKFFEQKGFDFGEPVGDELC
ncbi:MAG: AbrB/MazE/SpoVT family DNA-binding domain-containing protein [Oscillospiraceae bacterium]|nr:AbrB/MazE/SpoVT family DNA-binding domain-containing protein [Oscillospiraceae bacterium]